MELIQKKADLVKVSAYVNFVLWTVLAFLWVWGFPIPKLLLFLAIVA